MEAAVNSLAEALPSEILVNIFSYCSHQDLVQSIRNVCSWWREVAQSTSLWRNVTYSPEVSTSSEQVVEMLKISPELQNIILNYKHDDSVLQAITDNCAELRMLEINHVDLEINFIKKLQQKCPKVQHLRIPYLVMTDLEKCNVVAKFSNLKVILLSRSNDFLTNNSIKLKPIADNCKKLERLEFLSLNFELSDLCLLLSMRKDTLRTLAVPCLNLSGECVLPSLSSCELKSLSLFLYDSCPRPYEKIQGFGRLKTVRALTVHDMHLVESDHLKQIFENKNMAQLVELTLDESSFFNDDVTEVIVRNCHLLKYLCLLGCQDMTDASLKMMSDLKELNSLTIARNGCVTDTGILNLQDVQGLKCLRILFCWKLTKVGLGNIAKLCTLRDLSLESQDLAEFPWDQIPLEMKHLRYLGIHCCENVDLLAIEKLKRELPHLKVEAMFHTLTDFLVSRCKFSEFRFHV